MLTDNMCGASTQTFLWCNPQVLQKWLWWVQAACKSPYKPCQ